MTFRSKIWLSLFAVGVVPLLLLGWLSYRSSRAQVAEVVGRLQTQNALELAHGVEQFVANGASTLQLAVSYLPFDQLSRDEIAAILTLPYRQFPHVNIVAVLDESARAVAPPMFESSPQDHPELAGHEPVDAAALELFSRRIPLEAALAARVAVGPPYRPEGRPSQVAVAVRIEGVPPKVMAAELSLAEMERRLAAVREAGQVAYLVGPDGALLAHGASAGALDEEERRLVGDGLAGAAPLVRTLRRGGEEWLAAFAPVPRLRWGVVVAEPAAQAFGAAERVKTWSIAWAVLGMLLALGLGWLLARGLSRPIAALSEVARSATAGTLAPSPRIEGTDELGQFGRAFNHMIGELKRRDDEIRGFNEELQQRVDERTAELRAAQDQILRTRRLAAIGSLGAGVAHELNNPLTSVIGLASALKRDLGPDSPKAQALDLLLQQAGRAARIVGDLRQFATHEQEAGGGRFSPEEPVRAALASFEEQLRAAGIELHAEIASGLPQVQGAPGQIQQLVGHLVQNAVNAMPGGGRLHVGLGAVESEAVRLSVGDSGKGIPKEIRERIFDPFFSTKDLPAQVGMGLALCHGIVEAHHGKISVDSAAGKGSVFTVLLPAAPPPGHLY